MNKLLILINRLNFVSEYVNNDIFENAPNRVKAGSLIAASLYANSPNSNCVSVIVNSRQSTYRTNGR